MKYESIQWEVAYYLIFPPVIPACKYFIDKDTQEKRSPVSHKWASLKHKNNFCDFIAPNIWGGLSQLLETKVMI